jgi:purine catabolism regulator
LQRLVHVFPLRLAGESFGLIIINSPREEVFPVSWHSSINFAKTAIIMNLQKEIAVRNAELKYKDSFLKDLMFHHIHPEDDTMEGKMASFFGTSFLPPFVVMVLDRDNIATYEGEGDGDDRVKRPRSGIQMREELHSRVYHFLKVHFGRVHYTSIGGKMVALISLWPAMEENLKQLEHLIDKFRAQYRDERGETLSVAIGNTINEIFNVDQSYKQAKTCIDFAKSSGIEDAFFSWSRLGIMRLLFAASNNKTNREEIRNFVEKYLGKLKELPPKEAIRQLETLKALSRKGWNLKDTAKALHVHYNTIRYRLKMLEELIPYDLQDPEVRVEIYVALKLYHINKELKYF